MSETDLQRTFRRYQETADPRLLAEVFDGTAADLLALARHLVADEATAEDAVQATFLTAMEKAQRYDARRPLSPWLAGILARHARRARRSAARRPDERRLARTPPTDPARDAQEADVEANVVTALERLAPVDREVLTPFLVAAERPAAIAAALGISPNATYVRLHRALARLRRALPAGLAPALALAPNARAPRGLQAVREALIPTTGSGASSRSSAGPAPASLALPALIVVGLASFGAITTIEGVGRLEEESRFVLTSLAPDARGAEPPTLTAEADGPGPIAARSPARTGEPLESVPPAAGLVTYSGAVAHMNGSPMLEGVEVWLTATPDGSTPARLVARSDAGGRYRFTAEPNAHERLRIHKPGFADFRVSTAPSLRERDFQELCLNVGDGGRVSLFTNLRPAALVRGSVVDADGAPVAGATLSLFRPWMDPRGDYPDGKTRADGSFVLEGGVPWRSSPTDEPWILCATSPFGCGWTELVVPEGTEEIEDVAIALRRGRDLEVLIVDGDGSPVAGVSLRAVPAHGPWAAIPDRFIESEPIPADECFGAVSGTDGRARFRSLPLFERAESPYAGSVTVGGSPITIYRVVVTSAAWHAREETSPFPLAPPGSPAEAFLANTGSPDRLVVEPQPRITRK